jgi:hypothetical protein
VAAGQVALVIEDAGEVVDQAAEQAAGVAQFRLGFLPVPIKCS